MKKEMVHKKSSEKKTVKRTVPKSSKNETLYFRRIIIISMCLVLAVGATTIFNRSAVRSAVQGVSTMAGLYEQATIKMPQVPNAAAYNIYYGPAGNGTFTNAVRDIPPTVTQYTISDLKEGVTYEYRIAALNKHDKEFYFSSVSKLPTTNQ
jgi:Fibronectin type III domain